MDIDKFKKDGFFYKKKLLDKKKCMNLYQMLKKSRPWGKRLFISEKSQPKTSSSNPGKGVQNLVDKYDLSFIEKNPKIIKILNIILGKKYEIMLSKFVVAVPIHWLPNYLKKIIKTKYVSNLNPYIKKKYRDVTYFKGSDYHMDSIDWEGKSNKFITMYIYLNSVDKYMSPLFVLKKSFKLGPLPYPHYIKKNIKNSFLDVSPDNKKFFKFKKKKLIGNVGNVYFWTSNTLHGSSIVKKEKNVFRISLRYLIKRKGNESSIIEKITKQKVVKNTRILKNRYTKYHIEASKRKIYI